MNRKLVENSQKVKSWAYDEPTQVMEVEYVWGSIIRFFEVPPILAKSMEEASSKGSFVSKFIEYKYPRRKLAAGEDQLGPGTLGADEPAERSVAVDPASGPSVTKYWCGECKREVQADHPRHHKHVKLL